MDHIATHVWKSVLYWNIQWNVTEGVQNKSERSTTLVEIIVLCFYLALSLNSASIIARVNTLKVVASPVGATVAIMSTLACQRQC